MKTQLYHLYPDAFPQISEADASAYGGKLYAGSLCGGRPIPTDEVVLCYPEMEEAISNNCRKLAHALARGTHHTTKEWHDTIVVTLMHQLFPGFSDEGVHSADEEQS